MAGGPIPPTTFLQKLKFRPGINREATFYANSGGYWDGSRIRFRDGRPESIGGWQKNSGTFVGVNRFLISWADLDGNILVGVGTSWKFYINFGGIFYDITPERDDGTFAADPFASTIGSTLVTVTHTAHGALENDYVIISSATTFGGIPALELNAEHRIVSVPNGNSYVIEVTTAATSTDSAGGGTPDYTYLMNSGLNTVILASGYGAAGYGEQGYGEAATVFVAGAQLRLWTGDVFGEDLIFTPRDGEIYYWDRSGGFVRAVAVRDLVGANEVPLMASQIVVSSNDRHVLAFGTNAIGDTAQDRMLIRWCDQENVTEWEPRFDTTAGDLRISLGSSILRAMRAKNEILVFTDVSLHSIQWVGPPYFFGQTTISTNTTLMAPNAVVDTGDLVIWMGVDNFYVYTGRVEVMPCSLREYVFGDINLVQTHKIFAATNKLHSEATFFYPSTDSDECDRYVSFNLKEGVWYGGALARTAWLDQGLFRYPLASATDGYLYDHELGDGDGEQNPPVGLDAFIETSPIELADGDRFMLIRRLLPDISFVGSSNTAPTVDVEITGHTYPGGGYSPTQDGTITRTAVVELEQFTNDVPLRLRARSVAFRFSTSQTGVKWRVGDNRIELRPDGKK